MEHHKIVVFESKKIRRIWHEEEWYFSVVDICGALTDAPNDLTARKYWNKLAQRLRAESSEAVTNCHRLKLEAPDGKMRETDCANTKGMFRRSNIYNRTAGGRQSALVEFFEELPE